MDKERLLREKFGSDNHFRVPEGYFDSFADRMMEQIAQTDAAEAPKAKRLGLIGRLKPYLYLAAMFGGLFFGIKAVKYGMERRAEKTTGAAAQLLQDADSEQYIADFCDYADIDHDQIYAYVTGDELGY